MRHSVASCVQRAPSLGVALIVGFTIWSWAAVGQAQQTISTDVNGPIFGNDNSITITASGSVTSQAPSGIALLTNSSNTITTLSNSGDIEAFIASGAGGYGLFNDTATIDAITNSGSWDGEAAALRNVGTVTSLTNQATGRLRGTLAGSYAIDNLGTITTLVNSGTFTATTAVSTAGTIGSFTNQSGGVVGLGDFAITVSAGGTISSLSNSGSISATSAITNDGTITSLVNAASITGSEYALSGSGILGTLTNSGTIRGTDYGVVYQGIAVSGTLSNAAGGSLKADNYDAVRVEARLGLLQNAGHISGGTSPNYRSVAVTGTLDRLENTGLIDGSAFGVHTSTGGASIGTLTNTGTISGSDNGIRIGAGTSLSKLENLAGGLITSTSGSAVFNGGTITSFTNDGSLVGVRGLENTGTITTIINTGSLGSVHNDGTIGGGAGKTAISSKGSLASIGTLFNNGTVSGDIVIARQDFDISSSSSGATLSQGTITVSDGSMNLLYGNTLLDSDVAVASALNNYADLSVEHERNIVGSYLQGSSSSLAVTFLTDTDYGRLKITGSTTLAGLLDLYDPNSVVSVGSTFQLLTFASNSGNFGSLAYQGTALTDMGGGSWTDGTLLFREIWSPTSLSLTVSAVPEPSAIVLGAVGIAGGLLLEAKKRRALARRLRTRTAEDAASLVKGG